MRKVITNLFISVGLFGAMWFIATIDNLNYVPLLGLLIAGVCLPAAWTIGADYITEKLNEEGDEDEEWQCM